MINLAILGMIVGYELSDSYDHNSISGRGLINRIANPTSVGIGTGITIIKEIPSSIPIPFMMNVRTPINNERKSANRSFLATTIIDCQLGLILLSMGSLLRQS